MENIRIKIDVVFVVEKRKGIKLMEKLKKKIEQIDSKTGDFRYTAENWN